MAPLKQDSPKAPSTPQAHLAPDGAGRPASPSASHALPSPAAPAQDRIHAMGAMPDRLTLVPALVPALVAAGTAGLLALMLPALAPWISAGLAAIVIGLHLQRQVIAAPPPASDTPERFGPDMQHAAASTPEDGHAGSTQHPASRIEPGDDPAQAAARRAQQAFIERLQLYYEHAETGMALARMDGRLINANRRYLQMLGFAEREQQTGNREGHLGRQRGRQAGGAIDSVIDDTTPHGPLYLWDVTPEEFEARQILQVAALRGTGQYGPWETEYLRRDGQRAAVILSASLVTDTHGEQYIWITVEDISARRKAEQELARRHLRLEVMNGIMSAARAHAEPHALVAQVLERVHAAFPEHRITQVRLDAGSALWSERLRCEAQDPNRPPEASTCTTPAAPVDLQAAPGLLQRLMTEPIVPIANLASDPQASAIATELQARGTAALLAVPMDDHEGRRHLLCLESPRPHAWSEHESDLMLAVAEFLGMTLREIGAQRELAEAEQRFRLMADSAPVIIWVASREGQSEYLNQAWAAFTGEPAAHPRAVAMADLIHPEDRAQASRSYEAAARQGITFESELRVRRHDGEWRWLLVRGTPRRSVDGRFAGMVGSALDVTERRAAELQTRMHRDELRLQVAERTAHLQHALRAAEEARRQAEAANQAKSTFLANMSHELRTPMHAILSFAQLSTQRLARGGAADISAVTTQLGHIRDSGSRLLGLLNDLLDLSKLEAGRMELDCELNDLRAVVHQVGAELSALARARQLELVLPDESMPARFDAIRIAQVVRNLLSNAMKFSPEGKRIVVHIEGGLALSPSGEGPDATVPPSHLCLQVLDEGIGIPETELEQVFDEFVQSSKTRTGAGGTGLGLAICRRIVELHGGRIMAGNRPEGGAALSVWLPLEGPPPPRVAPQAEPVRESEADRLPV